MLYLPIFTTPSSVDIKNNKSAIDNVRFVSSEIEKMVRKGCMQKVIGKPKVVNPLTVADIKTKIGFRCKACLSTLV